MIMMTPNHHLSHILRYLKTPKNPKNHVLGPFLGVYGHCIRLYGLYVRVVVVKTPSFGPNRKVILGTNFCPNFCTIMGPRKFWPLNVHLTCPKPWKSWHFHGFRDFMDHEIHEIYNVKIWCWSRLWDDFCTKSAQIWKFHDILGIVTKMTKIPLKV